MQEVKVILWYIIGAKIKRWYYEKYIFSDAVVRPQPIFTHERDRLHQNNIIERVLPKQMASLVIQSKWGPA